jgi:antitoxin component of RelBE/YafQ-DinJ toxin-antitoxin module
MNPSDRFAIRIEGDPATDALLRDVIAYAKKIGLKPTTAARMLIRRALDEGGERGDG